MNIRNFLTLIFGLVLSIGAAHGRVEGVVVEKTSKPTPFSYSLGGDCIYKMQLRDRNNQIHSQLVRLEVFRAYEVGDHFDSAGELPVRSPSRTTNSTRTATVHRKTVKAKSAAKKLLPAPAAKKRIARASLTREVLPETEGF